MLRRILIEKRVFFLVLAVAVLVNAALCGLVVYPLSVRVAGAAGRAASALDAERAAGRDHDTAKATVSGKDRAQTELKKFYQDVLPADLAAARRITYLRLAQLARESNVRAERRSYEEQHERESTLIRLHMTMVLQGDYASLRRFIYRLESAPDFVVIDNVALSQRNDPNAPLLLTLSLSTYFRAGDNGA